ncbi:hypothetical protein ACEPAI_4268 [Sanghuangporus weigelae]
MPNPFAPNLPPDALWLERATLIGDILADMFYGATVVIFLQTMYALLNIRKSRPGENRNIVLIAFTTILFVLATVFVSMDTHSLQLGFIDNREYPGGPIAYTLSKYSDVITVFPNACFIITAWLADGFLLYRCILVFRFELYILALPVLMYLGSIAMGVLLLFQTSQPSANLWTKVSINFGIPYFSLSMSLNVVVTILIATRLLLYRRKLLQELGPQQVSVIPYVSIAAMIVESSMFYAVFSLLFLGPYGAKSHISNIFLPIVSQVQVIAPMLITFRVATRRAWDRSTATAPITNIKFHTRAASSEDTESAAEAPDATEVHLPSDQTEGSNEKILTRDTEERFIRALHD